MIRKPPSRQVLSSQRSGIVHSQESQLGHTNKNSTPLLNQDDSARSAHRSTPGQNEEEFKKSHHDTMKSHAEVKQIGMCRENSLVASNQTDTEPDVLGSLGTRSQKTHREQVAEADSPKHQVELAVDEKLTAEIAEVVTKDAEKVEEPPLKLVQHQLSEVPEEPIQLSESPLRQHAKGGKLKTPIQEQSVEQSIQKESL